MAGDNKPVGPPISQFGGKRRMVDLHQGRSVDLHEGDEKVMDAFIAALRMEMSLGYSQKLKLWKSGNDPRRMMRMFDTIPREDGSSLPQMRATFGIVLEAIDNWRSPANPARLFRLEVTVWEGDPEPLKARLHDEVFDDLSMNLITLSGGFVVKPVTA